MSEEIFKRYIENPAILKELVNNIAQPIFFGIDYESESYSYLHYNAMDAEATYKMWNNPTIIDTTAVRVKEQKLIEGVHDSQGNKES